MLASVILPNEQFYEKESKFWKAKILKSSDIFGNESLLSFIIIPIIAQ